MAKTVCELEHPAGRPRPGPIRSPPAKPVFGRNPVVELAATYIGGEFTLKVRVSSPPGRLAGARQQAGRHGGPVRAAFPFPGAAATANWRLERHHRALRSPFWRAQSRQGDLDSHLPAYRRLDGCPQEAPRPRPRPTSLRFGARSESCRRYLGRQRPFDDLVPPHPGPLPWGEGASHSVSRAFLRRWVCGHAAEDSPSPVGRGLG